MATQATTPPAATVVGAPPPAPICCVIAARTPVSIVVAETLSSRTARPGQRFAIRLVAPIIVDEHVIVPAGTTGVGEVVHAARARAMGKAGELIIAARYLDLGGTRIPLRTLRFGPAQGRDDSGAVLIGSSVAGAFVPVAGAIAFFIAGGEIEVPGGTAANALTAAEMSLPPHHQD